MISRLMARQAPVAQRIEEVSGIRPVTLLIASGIALIIGILMTTGIAADHLRRQAVATTEGELGRISSLLAATENRPLSEADAELAEIAGQLRQDGIIDPAGLREAMARPQIDAALRAGTNRVAGLDAIAVIAANGSVLARAGAWPAADIGQRDLFAAGRTMTIGTPIRDPRTDTTRIPLAHRIDGPQGAPLGAVVGLVRAADLSELFAAVPLADDAAIMLLRSDGTPLADYPRRAVRATGQIASDRDLGALFADTTATMISHVRSNGGGWRIEALHAVADYPAAIAVSRNADRALADWYRQGLWFGAFALAGSVVIALMIYLIARQFQTYGELAAARAETIEAERARLAAEAELLKTERLSVLGQLTATVAHELRNPLSAIRNTLFTIKELAAAGGIKLDRPAARMERSIERCDRIISDLLEYTRNRALNRGDIHFERWLGEVLADLTVAPDIVLTRELGAGDTIVSIDGDRIRRVVINLVDNSMQAMAQLPPDHEKRITVRTAVAAGEMVLAVEDSGPGILPENLTRIFEPLFSTKSFGTGLGLPTVKQIINQHGGMIAVESDVGKGTRVTVRLPLEAEAIEAVRVAA